MRSNRSLGEQALGRATGAEIEQRGARCMPFGYADIAGMADAKTVTMLLPRHRARWAKRPKRDVRGNHGTGAMTRRQLLRAQQMRRRFSTRCRGLAAPWESVVNVRISSLLPDKPVAVYSNGRRAEIVIRSGSSCGLARTCLTRRSAASAGISIAPLQRQPDMSGPGCRGSSCSGRRREKILHRMPLASVAR